MATMRVLGGANDDPIEVPLLQSSPLRKVPACAVLCRRAQSGGGAREGEAAMSSKRAIRRKACRGKVRYVTQAEAAAGAGRARRLHGAVGLLSAYHCQFCGGFHFGHPPRRVRQAMAAGR
jgi:hypothetical protein